MKAAIDCGPTVARVTHLLFNAMRNQRQSAEVGHISDQVEHQYGLHVDIAGVLDFDDEPEDVGDHVKQLTRQKSQQNDTEEAVDFLDVIANQSVVSRPFHQLLADFRVERRVAALGQVVDEFLQHHRRHPAQTHEINDGADRVHFGHPRPDLQHQRSPRIVSEIIAEASIGHQRHLL